MERLRPTGDLLERVAAYTAEAVAAVSASDLSTPTPCAQWDLLSSLRHVHRSLGFLIASLEDGGRPGDRRGHSNGAAAPDRKEGARVARHRCLLAVAEAHALGVSDSDAF
ncbi:MAG TPA: maleylpyruvate isomerase N-terminal domain-containing protein [Actinocrinis sp.]|nr:maleylpyruvate isomerase N-terminal domain-containing protein [Actinocrinis sp.]